jgi:hypothetical protein
VPKPEDRVQWLIKKLAPRNRKRRIMHAWKFATTKYVVVSFPKSGRTWLRAILTFYFEARYGLVDPPLLEFANLHYMDRRIPKIYFTHDDDSRARPEALSRDKSHYRRKHVLFLARDPRDVSVSMYFHRAKRSFDLEAPIFEFVNGPSGGLRSTIEFMNIWAEVLEGIDHTQYVAYESMHAEPRKTLCEVLRFFGQQPDPQAVEVAIERASFDNLRAMEERGAFESARLTARDAEDSDSFKVRRGKVGGYADYFDAEQREELDGLVSQTLSPTYESLLKHG